MKYLICRLSLSQLGPFLQSWLITGCRRHYLPFRSTWAPCFCEVHVAQSLVLYVVFCRSLFVHMSFFFWSLHCLSVFGLRLLITPLGSSNFSKKNLQYEILKAISWMKMLLSFWRSIFRYKKVKVFYLYVFHIIFIKWIISNWNLLRCIPFMYYKSCQSFSLMII